MSLFAICLFVSLLAPRRALADPGVSACNAINQSTVVCNNVRIVVQDPKLQQRVDQLAALLWRVIEQQKQTGKSDAEVTKQIEGLKQTIKEQAGEVAVILDALRNAEASVGILAGQVDDLRDATIATAERLSSDDARNHREIEALRAKLDEVRRRGAGRFTYLTSKNAIVPAIGARWTRPIDRTVGSPATRVMLHPSLQYRHRLNATWLIGLGAAGFIGRADEDVEFTSSEPGAPVFERTSVSASYFGFGPHIALLMEAPFGATAGWLAFEARVGAYLGYESWERGTSLDTSDWTLTTPFQLMAHARIWEGAGVFVLAGALSDWDDQPFAVTYALDGSSVVVRDEREEFQWVCGIGGEYAYSL